MLSIDWITLKFILFAAVVIAFVGLCIAQFIEDIYP